MNEWTLIGEAGKTVDATERTLEELRVQGLRVQFQSMAVSSMSWTVWLAEISEVGTYVPELRQKMTLFVDGDRFFTGWVVGRDPLQTAGRLGYRITVVDAWYFLANTMLSSEVLDGAGDAKERPVYLLPAGDLTDHLQSVVSRAVALGMPIQAGAMADGFDVPRLSLQNQSIGAALADLMAWMADGVMWLDHSGSGAVAVQMSRRASATTITLEHGTAIIGDVDLKPRVDLEVEEVKLATAKRSTVGSSRVTIFDEYTAGTANSVLPTRGLVAVTGPEINLTLPQDLTDSVEVEVAAITPTAVLQHAHPLLRQVSGILPSVYDAMPDGQTWPADPMLVITDIDGEPVEVADWPSFLTKGEPRDWWTKDGIEYKQIRVTATMGSSIRTGLTDEAPEDPQWARIVGARRVAAGSVLVGGVLNWEYVWEATLSASVTAVRGLSSGTIIRKEDWGWFNPPPDLAANLLASQNFTPWEGSVSTIQEELAHGNPVGAKLNISNWVGETATMGALITGCTIVPRTGEVVYQCGPPLRHSFLDLVNRFRQTGADNYYWLADPDDTGEGGWTAPGGGGGGTPANATLMEDGQIELTEDGQNTLDES